LPQCSTTKRDGTPCNGVAIDGTGLCVAHHPEYADARRRHASKGGKRGGRGRPVTELARIQSRFEELAEQVLSGEVERAKAAVACQLLNGARACIRDGLRAREMEEFAERLEELERVFEERKAGNRR
jgi:hypothetical protein